MAKFMVKASEFKNVCKAVNDRKLAELKKEIIEILKKQDENDFKKATDYLNSQEEHFTHLEKSLNGKWIEKAGYGIGTVRVWKGKKYKKIAPDKWVRVFDKEGRGTNIAIGKLIAKVQKIDNVEDLMAFVMANKSRFVDENGKDLPILDKLRAEIDIRNETLSGESSPYVYGVGENVSREKNKIFEGKEKITKEEADLHKVSRKFEQIPTTELKQRKAKLERWIENKTRNKRDSLNNAIFRENYQKELDAINAVLDKRNGKKETSEPAEKYDDSLQQMIDNSLKHGNYMTSKDVVEQDLKELVYDLKTSSKNKIIERLAEEYKFANTEYQRLDKKADVKELSEKEQNTLERFKRQKEKAANQKYFLENFYKEEEKPAEKKTKTQEDYEKEYEQSLKGKNDAETLDNIVEAYDSLAKELRPEAKEKGVAVNELNNPKLEALGQLRLKYSEKNISEGEKKYREEIEKLSGRMKEAIDNEFGYEKESEAEKRQNHSDAMKGNKNAYKGGYAPSESTNLETKKAIAENKNIGENEVQMPYSKELAAEMETLKDCVSRDRDRQWMQHVYYNDGNLVATDGRRVKAVKVGKLDGIENNSFVNIDVSKNGINIKKMDGMEGAKFPEYNRVIPNDLSQKVTLNNKVIKDKIKEMKKDGAIDKKTNRIQLEFKDGKVYLDDTEIGEAKNINLKYSDDWGPAREETNFISVNADYFENALTGNSSTLMLGERADKAMGISTDSTTNIIMPMNGTKEKIDYSEGREAKKARDDFESEEKKKHQDAMNSIVDTQKESMSDAWVQNLINRVNNKEMDNHKAIIEHSYNALKEAEKMIDKPTKKWTSSLTNNKYGFSLLAATRKNSEFKTALENMANEYGLIKKSLFDDFVIDNFIEEDIDDIEEEKEEESLWNDYSAEKPEDFNSVKLQVQEAMNRHYSNCL